MFNSCAYAGLPILLASCKQLFEDRRTATISRYQSIVVSAPLLAISILNNATSAQIATRQQGKGRAGPQRSVWIMPSARSQGSRHYYCAELTIMAKIVPDIAKKDECLTGLWKTGPLFCSLLWWTRILY